MGTEDTIEPADRHTCLGLTDIANRNRLALSAGLQYAIVTFGVDWMPGVDDRFYDNQGLAAVG